MTDTGRPWLDLLISPAANPTVVVLPLSVDHVRDVGLIAADARLPDAPPGTVHAVYVARERGWPVVTKDPDAVLALSSDVRTETIP